MKIVRHQYNGTTAIYIDGELAVHGDIEDVLEGLAISLNFEEHEGDDFLGGTHAPLETVEEINAYAKHKITQKIEELRRQINTLERESAMLDES